MRRHCLTQESSHPRLPSLFFRLATVATSRSRLRSRPVGESNAGSFTGRHTESQGCVNRRRRSNERPASLACVTIALLAAAGVAVCYGMATVLQSIGAKKTAGSEGLDPGLLVRLLRSGPYLRAPASTRQVSC